MPALWLAVRRGDAEAFFKEQALRKELISVKDESGATLLHWLALQGDLDNARRALELGAPVSARAPAI